MVDMFWFFQSLQSHTRCWKWRYVFNCMWCNKMFTSVCLAKVNQTCAILCVIKILICGFMFRILRVSAYNVTSHHHSVLVYDDLILQCGGEITATYKWEHAGKVIFFHTYFLDDYFFNTTVVFFNYSIFIQNVSLYHDGVYQCFYGEVSGSSYNVEVKGIVRQQNK